jgi:ribonuclease Z
VPARELTVLGTASQAPTRYRSHNACFLRWDREGLLFDPGEGAQRQLLIAGIPHSAITRILITHFHGDHCLGLPGVIQRLCLDRVDHPVDVYFPASGTAFFERLRAASIFEGAFDLRTHPIDRDGAVEDTGALRIVARQLLHRVETFGWRLEEPDGLRMQADRLEMLGIRGPDVGHLRESGEIRTAGGRIRLEEVSEPRPGQSFAFVMDTSPCPGAEALARSADLLVCESTFLSQEVDLAHTYGHMTAAGAARQAADAAATLLVLTHFSQRYRDEEAFAAEAAPIFPNVIAARDLLRIPVPPRRPSP